MLSSSLFLLAACNSALSRLGLAICHFHTFPANILFTLLPFLFPPALISGPAAIQRFIIRRSRNTLREFADTRTSFPGCIFVGAHLHVDGNKEDGPTTGKEKQKESNKFCGSYSINRGQTFKANGVLIT